MKDTTRIEIDGYSFEHTMGIEARREQRAVEVLSKKMDMNVPQTVMKVYKQIISQKLFHTQVGYDFLKGLQNYLITNPEINNADVDTIEIDSPEESLMAMNAARQKRGEKPSKVKGGMVSDGKYKTRARLFMATTIVLVATVVAMFAITLTSRVPTILNYKEQLNDNYARWAEDLSQKEAELTERELELSRKENLSSNR